MRLFHPRSFRGMLFAGYALVAAPLLVALLTSAISVNQLVNRSQLAVYQAVQATQSGRRLAEALTTMERSARQTAILGDRSLVPGYEAGRERFLAVARELAVLPFDAEQKAALDDIEAREAGIYAALSRVPMRPGELEAAVAGFIPINERVRAISARANELIDREIEAMRETAGRAQSLMFWQMLALIPVVVFLVAGFTILIARPIREIDSAISRLGAGDFAEPVVVNGPEDLQLLGARLEWTRLRLADLEEQKHRFLRQVSHELKTPLTAIREGTELLVDGAVGQLAPAQLEVAAILRHNGIALQRLIEDLLSYGAAQFHKTELQLEPVDVLQAVRRVTDDHKLALGAKSLALDVDVDDVMLMADGEKLRVMLDNLLSNAIKFSPQGGRIAVRARRSGGQAEIEVGDEGPGIAPEDRARVFDPFWQGRQTGGSLVKGTGIGLSVVREYAQAHGGGVEVSDNPGGRGAMLRLRLPLTRQDAEI